MNFNPTQKLTKQNFNQLPQLCSDGAWGTECQKLGAQPGQLFEAWNVEQPEKVFSVANAYIKAGAQIILTNTFTGNVHALERHNAGDRVVELSKAGAEISKRAAAGKAYVFASLGPTGKLVSMGELTVAEAEAAYAQQAEALAEGGADALVVETQTDLEEAEAGIRGCQKVCDLPVGVSFSFDSGKDGTFTMMGVSVEQAYAMAKKAGAQFVGANCGRGIETYIEIAERFQKCGNELPIWIKGNAGIPEIGDDGETIYQAGPEIFATAVGKLLSANVRMMGGCCGSTPNHIQAMAQELKKWNEK